MTIHTGERTGTLHCPHCGADLAAGDIVYRDEMLRLVGCEYCIMRLPALEDTTPAYPLQTAHPDRKEVSV